MRPPPSRSTSRASWRWPRAVVAAALVASTSALAPLGLLARAAPREDAIAYDAPKECASAGAFADRVGERTGRSTKVSPTARHRVRIARSATGFHGTLTVTEDGATHERAVDGRSCGEVFDALALVTAMAFEAPEEPEPPASASSAPPPRASSSASADAAFEPADRDEGADAFGVVRLPPPATSTSAAPASPWSIGANYQLVALDGAPPMGGSIYGEWAADSTARLAPSVRLGIARTWARREASVGGTLGLGWLFGTLDACATRAVGAFRFDLCGVAHAGALSATPDAIPEGRSAARGWLALGGSTRARATLGAGIYLELLLALTAPITRDRFVINGADGEATQTYSAPPAQLFAGLGLGFRIP